MTAFEHALLRAQITLLKSKSPTKGAARRYSDDDWRHAIEKVAYRLTYMPYRSQAR